jgi:hypothetical protein
MNTKKSQFVLAVRMIAPNDGFILSLAECVSEEALPEYPGGAALRFVAAVSRLCESDTLKGGPRSQSRSKPAVKSRRVTCRGQVVAPTVIPIRHLCDAATTNH